MMMETARVRQNKAGLQQVVWQLEGIDCPSCGRAIEKYLKNLSGVRNVAVNTFTATATITYQAQQISQAVLRQSLATLGYPVYEKGMQAEIQISIWEWLRFGLAMLVAASQMGTMLAERFTGIMLMSPYTYYVVNLVATLVVMLVAGWPIYSFAARGLVHKRIDMHTLVSISTLAAFIYSSSQIFLVDLTPNVHSHHGFWEVVSMVIALVILGKIINVRAKMHVMRELNTIANLQIKSAVVERDGRQVSIASTELREGDLVIVKPGEQVPVDGVVMSGESTLNEAIVTGEEARRQCMPGDHVYYGTVNGAGLLRVQAVSTGRQTVAGRVAQLISQVQLTKIPVQQKVDHVATYFVPAVLLLAAAAAIGWLLLGPEPIWLNAGIAFFTTMLIACPCALGLATPISLTIAISEAAKHGLLVRTGSIIQTLPEVDTFVFDKTGTLTSSSAELDKINILSGGENTYRYLVSLAQTSQHPVDRAICRHLPTVKPWPAHEVTVLVGRGIKGVVQDKKVVMGSAAFITRELGILPPRSVATGGSTVWVAIDNRISAVLTLSGGVRSEAANLVAYLQRKGTEIYLLTGDNQIAADQIASQLGIQHVKANLLPQDKLAFVQTLKRQGHKVAMLGDGFNDSPALAQADVGIVVGQGSAMAVSAGHLIITRGNLRSVITALQLARVSMKNVKQNLVAAFVYNLLCVPVAMGVLYPAFGIILTPWVATLAMTLSSITVTANALSLKRIIRSPDLT